MSFTLSNLQNLKKVFLVLTDVRPPFKGSPIKSVIDVFHKTSILLSDVTVAGDLVEKDKIIVDARISGDIKADDIEAHSNSSITGNITAKNAALGGKLRGNVNSDKISIKKTAEIEGVLNQKTLSIEEGAALKSNTETYK